ncbi:MAG: ABC transporter permease [Deltaproteobacteria bacterium]|nr:ABC transporter permease [Deltaproteobacteria bacterium]
MTMRAVDLVKSVRHTFATSRLRVGLTLLGIMIGTGAMVLLPGLLIAGEEALVRLAQHANESDMIELHNADPPAKDAKKTTRPLTSWDSEALVDNPLLEGAQINANALRSAKAHHGGAEKPTTLFSGEPDSLSLYRISVEQGRYFVDDDFRERRHVCVVGREVWTELLQEKSLKQNLRITVDGAIFEVVGVLAHKPTMKRGGTRMWNRRVVIPATTYQATFEPARRVRSVYVRLKDNAGLVGKTRQLTDVVEQTILRRHYGVKNFETESDARGADQEELILRIIEILLFATGVVALFVGGINIMNIMLVTVTERTKEIGLRRALGARPSEIAAQFVLEAAVLAGAGGVLGVVGGVVVTWLSSVALTEILAPWRFVVEAWAIGLALGMAVTVGVVFGLFPALRASRLNPVSALRSE